MTRNTTVEDLRRWFDEGVAQGATHLVVVTDTYCWDDYPVYVLPSDSVLKVIAKYDEVQMQRINEVYNLTWSKESQVTSSQRQYNL